MSRFKIDYFYFNGNTKRAVISWTVASLNKPVLPGSATQTSILFCAERKITAGRCLTKQILSVGSMIRITPSNGCSHFSTRWPDKMLSRASSALQSFSPACFRYSTSYAPLLFEFGCMETNCQVVQQLPFIHRTNNRYFLLNSSDIQLLYPSELPNLFLKTPHMCCSTCFLCADNNHPLSFAQLTQIFLIIATDSTMALYSE